jgi:hypothetical protein
MTTETGVDGTTRRQVLGGLASLACLARAGSAAAQPPALPNQGLALRKLAFSMDTAPFYWWLRGTRYGLVDGEMTPFWDMHVGSLSMAKDLPGGKYEVSTIYVSFYTDVATGQFIQKFKNPFTGKTVPILYFPARLSRSIHAPDGTPETPPINVMKGLTSRWLQGPLWVENGQVFLRSDHVLRGVDAGGKAVRVNDLSTYSGAAQDVLDPKILSVKAEQNFNDDNTWPAWLGMGNLPGTYFSRAFGRKIFDYAAMPPVWRSLMASHYPDIARNPARALAG